MFLDDIKLIYKKLDDKYVWFKQYEDYNEIEKFVLEIIESENITSLPSKFHKNFHMYLNGGFRCLEQIDCEKSDGFFIRKVFYQTINSLLQTNQPICLWSTAAPRYRSFWINFQVEWKNKNLSLESIVAFSIEKIKVRIYNDPGAEELLQAYYRNAWSRSLHFNDENRSLALFKLFFQHYSHEIIVELFHNQIST